MKSTKKKIKKQNIKKIDSKNINKSNEINIKEINIKEFNNKSPEASEIKYIKNRLDRNLLNEEDRKYIYKSHKREYIFDFEFYKKIYLNETCSTKDECFKKMKGWKNIGCKEEYMKRYNSNIKSLNRLLTRLEKEVISNKINITQNEENLINIIVRTHRREQNFTKCINSIKNQTYQNIRLLVSVDDDLTQDYVKKIRKNSGIQKFEIYRFEPKKEIGYWFNDYINFLFKEINSGYVIIIDDDNCLSSNYCLNYLIQKTNRLIDNKKIDNKKIHKTNTLNKNESKKKPLVINFLYFRNDKFVDVDTSSVFFHSDILKSEEVKMGVHRGGDHRLMEGLKKYGRRILIKLPLVRVTYDDYVTGGGKIFEN